MGREASPTDRTAQAEAIQEFRFVFRHTKTQELRFPRGRSRLESRELFDGLEQAGFSMLTRSRRKMLPLQQEPHEVRCRDRFHVFAQAANGQSMDPGQETSMAPFHRRSRATGMLSRVC